MGGLVRAWADAYERGVLAHSKPEEISNEEVFADVYHSLVHSSPAMSDTMLRLEHSHAEAVAAKCKERDEALVSMEERHNRDMSTAVERTAAAREEEREGQESREGERAVNDLAARHLEERQMAELKWESNLGNLRDTQRREFREWVMCVHEEIKTSGEERRRKKTGSAGSAESTGGISKSESTFSIEAPPSSVPVMQESFTVTLGAQMKQMHNLRLVAADPLDLCRYPEAQEEALPKRLQTSMSLYSNNLCGLVLLTDDRLSTFSGTNRDLAALCQRSTEFHFPSFEQQLQAIKEEHLSKALSWREEYRKRQALLEEATEAASSGDKLPAAPASEAVNFDVTAKYGRDPAERRSLSVGDFYVTRHSSLCEVHMLFHMVSDESAASGGINSRHPVVMGLRNVLKAASLCDVTTVTLPLLLTRDMGEEMTVAWCMKRAELVFKCVKGFMMEVASWGGSEIKTLQFLVPRQIDQDVFSRLTAMLATIFRTSNPIRGK